MRKLVNGRYKLKVRRCALYTESQQTIDMARALGISRVDVSRFLITQRVLLEQKLCQYDRVETPFGILGITRSVTRKYSVHLNANESLIARIELETRCAESLNERRQDSGTSLSQDDQE
jgi:hypothetical protein